MTAHAVCVVIYDVKSCECETYERTFGRKSLSLREGGLAAKQGAAAACVPTSAFC
jgi:hypothetical protein